MSSIPSRPQGRLSGALAALGVLCASFSGQAAEPGPAPVRETLPIELVVRASSGSAPTR